MIYNGDIWVICVGAMYTVGDIICMSDYGDMYGCQQNHVILLKHLFIFLLANLI